ncbi:MAG: class I SAM-dependent methyltransferase [Acidimicrobiales bacterium]
MPDVEGHYRSDGLTDRILEAVRTDSNAAAGELVDADALATVDEFHLGGRAATNLVAAELRHLEPSLVLDIGSGIGGTARTLARTLSCRVLGVDLTPEFVTTASDLTVAVGLDDVAEFRVGSALELPVDDAAVDAVTLVHVGMNIDDKATLAAEFARVLRPGGAAVIYDVMRVADGDLAFPMPWAAGPETSFVAEPERYVEALTEAGFRVGDPLDQAALVLDVLAAGASRPAPPVHLGHLMGPEFPVMFSNLVTAMKAGIVAPMLLTGILPA